MIMYLGRVMEFYTSEGIYADPKHPYTQALLSAIPPESPFDKKERLPLTRAPSGIRLAARSQAAARTARSAVRKKFQSLWTPATDIWWLVSCTNKLSHPQHLSGQESTRFSFFCTWQIHNWLCNCSFLTVTRKNPFHIGCADRIFAF